jgi:hypothetical protein
MTKEEIKEEYNEQQEEERYKKLSLLFIKFEEKSKIEVRNASYGHTRTDYVKGKDLEKAFKENLEMLCSEINQICDTKIDHKSPSSLQQVFTEFHRRRMLSRAARPDSEGKIKYPKRLIPLEEEDNCCGEKDEIDKKHLSDLKKFDPNYFFAIDIIRSKSKTYLWLFIAIFGVIMACLFPVWPIEVKIGIFWVSYVLLISMIVLIVVRYIVFTFFYIFGISFWIFPNFFDDTKGVIDSFLPLYSYEKRQDSILSILIRMAIAVFVAYIALYVYTNPESINDFANHLVEVYNDMFEFGKDKIVNYYVRIFLILLIELHCIKC